MKIVVLAAKAHLQNPTSPFAPASQTAKQQTWRGGILMSMEGRGAVLTYFIQIRRRKTTVLMK